MMHIYRKYCNYCDYCYTLCDHKIIQLCVMYIQMEILCYTVITIGYFMYKWTIVIIMILPIMYNTIMRYVQMEKVNKHPFQSTEPSAHALSLG